MKVYQIPIVYQSVITMTVEAEDLDKAVNKALNNFFAIPDENYIQDSFEIDKNYIEDYYPDESYEIKF